MAKNVFVRVALFSALSCHVRDRRRRAGGVRVAGRQRHRYDRRRDSGRHGHGDTYANQSHARSGHQRERRVLDSEYPVRNVSGRRRGAGLSDLYGTGRHRDQPRHARRREAGPRHARGSAHRHRDRGDSADRERRRAAHREQRAAADAADQRPRVPELHDADARRRRSELPAVGRHQQSRAHDVADDQRPARRPIRSFASTASPRRISSSRASRATGPASKRSRPSTSSRAASTPIRAWRVRPPSTCR